MATLASDFYPESILYEEGGLSASIHRCFGQQGEYFTTTFTRTFSYRGETYRTGYFRHEHLPLVSRLAKRSFAEIECLKAIKKS